MFTLQNFKRKVYPINSLVPAFFFRAKSNSDLKTQFLHLLLLLYIQMKLDECFFLMGLLFTISCPTTFNLWNMIPENRENFIRQIWIFYPPSHPLMPFYILLHISNMNQTKLGQRNIPFTKEWTTYNCSCWCLLIIKNMRKKLWKETLYTARIHSSERKFGTFVLPSFLPLLLYDNKCDKDCIEMRLTTFQEA